MNDLKKSEIIGASKMLVKGIVDAQGMNDGKSHRVRVIFSQYSGEFRMRALSLVVDDRRVDGMKLGVGNQTVLFDIEVFAPPKSATSAKKTKALK